VRGPRRRLRTENDSRHAVARAMRLSPAPAGRWLAVSAGGGECHLHAARRQSCGPAGSCFRGEADPSPSMSPSTTPPPIPPSTGISCYPPRRSVRGRSWEAEAREGRAAGPERTGRAFSPR
jgi:hypothetical protein